VQVLSVGQQASPALPHSAQKPDALQEVPAWAQDESAQQGCPAAIPQSWQT
jgi:hypothetical protein